MARTSQQIYDAIAAEMVTQYAGVGVTIDPSTWGRYNIRRLSCWTMAVCWATMENAWDQLVIFIQNLIATTKPHNLQWYVTKAKAFQMGRSLVFEQDYYDNTGLTDAQIAAEQIINFAAAEEVTKGIRMKLATISGGDLAPLSTIQLNAFKAYMTIVKDAGVKIYYVNEAADSLKLTMRIFYDPLVLDGNGQRLDGTANTPVQDAINDFLKNGIIFNGLFVPFLMEQALKNIDGVRIPQIDSIQAKYGALPFSDIDVEYRPDSGYLRIANPSDLTLTFVPHAVI